MKKVVVVVSLEAEPIFLESTNDGLDVIDGVSPAGLSAEQNPKLVIRDDKKTIAVFQHWQYWKKVE